MAGRGGIRATRPDTDPDFESALAAEILSSEVTRATILVLTFAASFALFAAVTLLFRPIVASVLVVAAVALYELFLRTVMSAFRRRGRRPPMPAPYMNALVECSVPRFGILYLASFMDPLQALSSPPFFVYFLFVVLSTLRLGFRLSAFTGAVAAIEYAVVAVRFLQTAPAALASTATHGEAMVGLLESGTFSLLGDFFTSSSYFSVTLS